MDQPVPILFLSDSPCQQTGLGRITRDLASLLAREPEFRVAILGLGGTGSRLVPVQQYSIQWNMATGEGQWGELSLPFAWGDWAGNERGIVLTIWDASRLHWFSQPRFLSDSPENKPLQDFLQSNAFDRWGYFPFDSAGPGGLLTGQSRDTLLGYDRIAVYTKWAQDMVQVSLGSSASQQRDLFWLPHGINEQVFDIRDKVALRRELGWPVRDTDLLIGVVGTNQARKDWGLMAQTARLLKDRYGKKLWFWWHTDKEIRHWNIPALLQDYHLADSVILTRSGKDIDMANRYGACDLTLHPGLGEGWGYPIAESLACGVPALHGNYGGGASLIINPDWLIPPVALRLDTQYNCFRPVFAPDSWAMAAEQALSHTWSQLSIRQSIEFTFWKNLWPAVWLPWFRRGLGVQ